MMKRKISYDRFIPFRTAMTTLDSGLLELGREKDKKMPISASQDSYRKQLAEVLNLNQTRILAFSNNPRPSYDFDHLFSPRPVMRPRYIPQTPERVLYYPGIVDQLYLKLLDWGSADVLAIALDNSVHLWDAFRRGDSVSEPELLFDVDQDKGPVTSLNWAADGCLLAVGLCNGEVQLWDSVAKRRVRTLKSRHQSGVVSLAWKENQFLTTGGNDGKIINNDVRMDSHAVSRYRGHTKAVCDLKWSPSGRQLASAGDNLVHIWDLSRASSSLHSLGEYTSAGKAIAWCPFESNLLATGGVGEQDGTIKFWNTLTGACLNSVNTGSQVSSLLWSNKERELLSSDGLSLRLWKYPDMLTLADFTAHTSNVVCMTQSMNNCTVATVAAGNDQSLKLWNVFGVPKVVKKPAPQALSEPFPHVIGIR